MALSNKFGWLVLTTGNKSEIATGYSTLYGDMAGGFAVIKDVPKMLVYALARDRNERAGRAARSPSRCSTSRRAPSCGPTSATATRCPTTTLLDPILEGYVEGDLSVAELEAAGFDPDTVRRDRPARRPQRVQAPPGAAGRARVAQGVRQGPAPADHEPLAWLNRRVVRAC